MQVKKDQSMWLSSLGDVELLWWDSNILVCSHEPSTSYVNQDYREPSGFQNCLQGLWYYLLNPNPVLQYLGCRLREQTVLNLSMKCIRQQTSGSAGPPFRKSYLHLTHDVNLLAENQYQAAEADEAVGCFVAGFPVTSGCFHWCRIFFFFFCLYVVKPAAGRNLPQE